MTEPMTPAQQAALEALAGRPLTADEIVMAQERQDDAVLAASLSATLPAIQGSVSSAVFSAWCASTGLRASIQDHSENAASALRSTALALLDLLRGAQTSMDFAPSSPLGQMNLAMLDQWVTAGAVTADQRTQLIALATTPATPIGVQQVVQAMGV